MIVEWRLLTLWVAPLLRPTTAELKTNANTNANVNRRQNKLFGFMFLKTLRNFLRIIINKLWLKYKLIFVEQRKSTSRAVRCKGWLRNDGWMANGLKSWSRSRFLTKKRRIFYRFQLAAFIGFFGLLRITNISVVLRFSEQVDVSLG